MTYPRIIIGSLAIAAIVTGITASSASSTGAVNVCDFLPQLYFCRPAVTQPAAPVVPVPTFVPDVEPPQVEDFPEFHPAAPVISPERCETGICGNGLCDYNEANVSDDSRIFEGTCPRDCKVSTCGNSICEISEPRFCERDCRPSSQHTGAPTGPDEPAPPVVPTNAPQCENRNVISFSISDDGRFVAYQAEGQSRTQRESKVFLWDRTTNVTIPLTHRYAVASSSPLLTGGEPLISGDGGTVVFTARSPGKLVSYDRIRGIYTFLYKGSAQALGLSNDGRYVLFQRDRACLMLLDRDTNTVKMIASDGFCHEKEPPILKSYSDGALLSGDGKTVVVLTEDRTLPVVGGFHQKTAYVIDPVAGTSRPLTSPHVSRPIALSDDGTRLMHAKEDGDTYGTYEYNIQTNESIRVDDIPGPGITNLSMSLFSGDLRSVVGIGPKQKWESRPILLHKRGAGFSRQMTPPLDYPKAPTISGDGDTIAVISQVYFSSDGYADRLFVLSDDGKGMIRVPHVYTCPPDSAPAQAPPLCVLPLCLPYRNPTCSYEIPAPDEHGCRTTCGTLKCSQPGTP